MNGRITKSLPHYEHAYSAFNHLLGSGHVVTKGLNKRLQIIRESAHVASETHEDGTIATWHESQSGSSEYPWDKDWHEGEHPYVPNYHEDEHVTWHGDYHRGAHQGADTEEEHPDESDHEGAYEEHHHGGHEDDPWSNTVYTSDSAGDATGSISVTQIGSVIDHVVVVHDSSGAKAGCGKLVPTNDTRRHDSSAVAAITMMPGYSGPASAIAGTFTLVHTGTQLSGVYTLTGLAANVTGSFHVHSGTSCSNVGSHLMNAGTVI